LTGKKQHDKLSAVINLLEKEAQSMAYTTHNTPAYISAASFGGEVAVDSWIAPAPR
jgi:hypothetical protein